jgi:hypothetical protein
VAPATGLAASGASLAVSGQGFTKNTNAAGLYVLFGYMVTSPAQGGSAGNGYDFNPGGGSSGQEGQLFIAWPDNAETGAAAHAKLTATVNGSFTAAGLFAQAVFVGQSGAVVNCLNGTVVCGVITIGAHGGRDAALETFTPVFFEGQEVPTSPIDVPEAPTAPAGPTGPTGGGDTPAAAPVANSSGLVEGSLVWGVKHSFRSYVTGSIAKGSISVSGGASTRNGLFWFGQTGTNWTESSTASSTSYGGAVRFYGHSGILNLTFSNPVVRIDSARSGTLLMSVNGTQVALGQLDLAAATRTQAQGGVAYSNVPVTLTASGARVFAYRSSQFYAAGTAMDPASFVIGGAAASTRAGGTQAVAAYTSARWTAPAAPPANAGLYIDPEQLKNIRPGSQITAIGTGYDPGEADIKVVMYSDPVVLEDNLGADAGGTATWTGVIPLDTEPGVHTLTFQGSQNLGIEITVLEAEELAGCAVASASLSWGFKESFRSYISGTIANGEWTVADGATYQTPSFGWADGQGVFDTEQFTGQVSFQGAIHFTGHEGLLETTVANPTILLAGPDTAYLLLDVEGLTMEDALAGNTDNVLSFKQVSFVEIDLSRASVEVSQDGAKVTVADAPTAITAQGFEAFPNYEAGTEFDPVSFELTTEAGCAVAPVVVEEEAAAPEPTEPTAAPTAAEDSGASWLWWAGGGLLAAGALAALVALAVRRRRAGGGTGGGTGGGAGGGAASADGAGAAFGGGL